ncbi:MAG: hypothetical protein JJU47_08210 [Exiguobacterium sp.]|nr:hypothetical protein [Exiguobacterium sp.]
MIPVLIFLIVSASYTVYSLYLSLTGQPIQPQLTGLAVGALFTSSYFLLTKQLPGWDGSDYE